MHVHKIAPSGHEYEVRCID